MIRILCDVDGVLAALEREWLFRYNRDWSDRMTPEDWTCWDIHTLVKPECGVKIYEYLKDDDLYDYVSPINGSQDAIKVLRDHNYDIVFVTSGIQPNKAEWLCRYGFLKDTNWFFSGDIVIAHNKSLIKGDIMIDDNPKNLMTFDGERILFTQPWNRSCKEHIYRADSWLSVLELL